MPIYFYQVQLNFSTCHPLPPTKNESMANSTKTTSPATLPQGKAKTQRKQKKGPKK
jgi:hypothetical protein